MKRRSIAMDADAFISSKVSLVERNPQPMGLQLVSPIAVGRTDRASLIELAQEIEMVSVLRRQAERVLSEAAQSHRLHHAACNFRKAPGSVYHLYRRPSGQEYLSMLAPQEWGPKGPPAGHEFRGSFRLEADRSWTPAGEGPPRPASCAVVDIFGPAEDAAARFDVTQPLRAIEGAGRGACTS
ncbi:uncharacterized protein C1orf50 homolog isoform X2 [Schistocerca gregaria]|uniref:uncharacterized protein C1orf50 homolog isoform X2 n=1 Tax=Schistocerca gregaria TaxID=7010 RepID=UPI00211DD4CF|nr:uncharacterized protein C1orf50 homolog isoform X2 [Schistocerca gregaria]XP_049843996.1 uncharacterized protein C1orf50 homolog isoform X2 [Schistocerca gregaria]